MVYALAEQVLKQVSLNQPKVVGKTHPNAAPFWSTPEKWPQGF